MPTTVIIPTYNRKFKIAETLEALNCQDSMDFEVILVDDGSGDGTAEHCKVLAQKMRYALQIVSQKNSGASAATNHGVELAKPGLIILFDDDIIPEPSCIAKHVVFHKAHPNSILSGSADTDPKRTITDVQRYKLFMELKWKEARPDTQECVAVHFDNFIITTANMSLDRAVFLSLGGFNVSLRDGYDVDFGFRALLNNTALFFDRTIKTIHNDQISLPYYASRQRAYTKSKQVILQQHPELANKVKFEMPASLSVAKKIIYTILRIPLLVSFFQTHFFASVVPKALRYRIYGSTIASLSRI